MASSHAFAWKLFSGDGKMKIFAAILSAVVATAIGSSSTYYVMTRVLEYKLEPEKSFYEPGEGKDKGKGKMGGKDMFGGKDGKGKGKGGQGGAPEDGKGGNGGAPNKD
jgi:hypothetical protein